jgi:UBX domain-containing protein 1
VPSQYIPDPTANRPRPPERVERVLHFWADGFSVDDGPLYSSSDPANAHILEMIRNGRAPLHVLNVQHTQEVDVKVEQHEGNYVQPKKKWKPFSGGGQRLGSPTPRAASGLAPPPAPAAAAATPPPARGPEVEVDESAPAITLQIRLGDGTRLSSRFNTTHTVGDVYSFVQASTPGQPPNWVLMTTFPTKELGDRAQVLGDLPEFKRGGVVVQKWT